MVFITNYGKNSVSLKAESKTKSKKVRLNEDSVNQNGNNCLHRKVFPPVQLVLIYFSYLSNTEIYSFTFIFSTGIWFLVPASEL